MSTPAARESAAQKLPTRTPPSRVSKRGTSARATVAAVSPAPRALSESETTAAKTSASTRLSTAAKCPVRRTM